MSTKHLNRGGALVVCCAGRVALKLQVLIGSVKDSELGHCQVPSLPPKTSLLRGQMAAGLDLEQRVLLSTRS